MLQGCRLFKWCRNLPASTVLQGCRLLKQCRNLPARNCVAGVQDVSAVLEPTFRALCYRAAVGAQWLSGRVLARHCVAVQVDSEPTCLALCCRGAGCLSGV